MLRDVEDKSGSTGVTALVHLGDIYVANVGDSRAFAYHEEEGVVVLSEDHVPTREDEKERFVFLVLLMVG